MWIIYHVEIRIIPHLLICIFLVFIYIKWKLRGIHTKYSSWKERLFFNNLIIENSRGKINILCGRKNYFICLFQNGQFMIMIREYWKWNLLFDILKSLLLKYLDNKEDQFDLNKYAFYCIPVGNVLYLFFLSLFRCLTDICPYEGT